MTDTSASLKILKMTDVHDLQAAVEPGEDKPGVKRVMVEDGARVVIFNFAAGQELTEHTAAFPILVQSVAGHLQFTADGRTTDLHPGDIAHLSARLPHAVHAVTDATLQLVMLDPKAASK
ncbi:cupin domain-containing protein [Tomitella biformata]|uniref:cupin domain-containing protein n=1 Tax=Tomitella biformata TaxID=630403 RepID=UPI0004BC83E9|nr:cupin domain-containing protein [Tomitella biformata]